MLQEYIEYILFKKMRINITGNNYVSCLKLTSIHVSKYILQLFLFLICFTKERILIF